jgi:nucleotide-binding universal stress UspA family protein
VVLHVVDEANAGDLARYADLPMEIILERMRQNGEKYIEVIRNMSTDGEVAIVGRICVGIPHRAILATAREEKIDLIVLGTVGRKGARRVLIGSVTERVIEYAHVPVLVVK